LALAIVTLTELIAFSEKAIFVPLITFMIKIALCQKKSKKILKQRKLLHTSQLIVEVEYRVTQKKRSSPKLE